MKPSARLGSVSRRDALRLLGAAGVAAIIPADSFASIIPADLWAGVLSQSPLRVNGARVNGHLSKLSEFGRNPQGGVSRVAYTDADRAARQWVMSLMRDAGLDPAIDAAGNIIGRRAGRDANRKPILF